MVSSEFYLLAIFDLCATFAFALTGALAAIKRGYDIVGVFFLALASGIGGGLIRDGVFITGTGPTPLLADPRYILVVVGATIFGAILGGRVKHLNRVIAVLDAVGLGAYAAFGTQINPIPPEPEQFDDPSGIQFPISNCCSRATARTSFWGSSTGAMPPRTTICPILAAGITCRDATPRFWPIRGINPLLSCDGS